VPLPASASVSAMATAARFSPDVASMDGARVNAAQRAAIFRRVVSSNDRAIPLDYNIGESDETTRQHDSPQETERTT
jgi:hypothetical protein